MANIKGITITGSLPFDLGATWDDGYRGINPTKYEKLRSFLYAFMQPHFGLKMTWERHNEYYVPNTHGGKTNMVPFTITGQEAVTFAWFDGLVEAIKGVGGTITKAGAVNLEA
jgi:hypothetical protein